jgi:hypothetical protein
MQMILNIPLMGLLVPSNVTIFATFIFQTLNFQIFNTDIIFSYFLDINDNLNEEAATNFQTMGFKSNSFIRNCGTYVLIFIAFIIALALTLVLRLILKKFPAKA